MSIYQPDLWRANLGVISPRVASWAELDIGDQGATEAAIDLASLDPAGNRWRMVSSNGTFSAVPDYVCRWGWNVAGAGGRENQGEHAVFVQLESDYYNGADHYSEWIIGWLSDDGTISRRPIQSAVNLRQGNCSTSVEGQFAIYDSGRSQPARFNVVDSSAAVTRAYFDDAIITVQPNDTAAITQLNPAGNSYTEIARVNASGYVQLAGAGGMTQTAGGLIVKSSVGQSWTDASGMRGLLLQEATSTRWNLAPVGSTTTIESGASLTITGGRELAYSASSGQTPDCVESRHTATTALSSATLFSFAMVENSSLLLEFSVACKNSDGVLWGQFQRIATFTRVGSGPSVIVGQTAISVGRSHPYWDATFVAGGVSATANIVVNTIDGSTLNWKGIVKRTVMT